MSAKKRSHHIVIPRGVSQRLFVCTDTQAHHYGKLDPGPRGMITIGEDYELDTTHQLLAEVEQGHCFALLPASWREVEAENLGRQHEVTQPLVLAGEHSNPLGSHLDFPGHAGRAFLLLNILLVVSAENEASLEAFVEKWSSNMEFIRRKRLRLAGEIDDQLPRRAFCQFVLEPLRGVCAAALHEQKPRLITRLKNLGARDLTSAELQLCSVDLMKAALRAWLPLDRAVASTVRAHLPSAEVAAGMHRFSSSDDGGCHVLLNQLLPVPAGISLPDGGRFVVLGRVFAGALTVVSLLETPEKRRGKHRSNLHHNLSSRDGSERLLVVVVALTGLWKASGEPMERIPAGSVVMVAVEGGVDSLKSCPVSLRTAQQKTTLQPATASRFDQAVMWVDVCPADKDHASKLQLQSLVHSAVLCTPGAVHRPFEEGFIIGACGELLLHLWIATFREHCAKDGVQATVGAAYVTLRESVSDVGHLIVSASTDRKHWLTLTAAPISVARIAALRKAGAAATAAAADRPSAEPSVDADSDDDATRQLDEALGELLGIPHHKQICRDVPLRHRLCL